MATGFSNFLNDSSPEAKVTGYDDYSKKVWGAAAEIVLPQDLTEKELGIEGMNPAQKFIALSQQKEAIESLTENAKIKNDPDGLGLRNLLSKFGASEKEPAVVKVELPEEVIRKHGGKAKDVVFGAKEMHTEADKERMKKYFDTAKEYLDTIELHFVKGKDGKETALVIGAGAKEFNAVIAAETRKEQLGLAVEQAKREMTAPAKTQEAEREASKGTLDMEKLKALAASLPSKPDPDRAENISPLPGGMGRQQNQGIGRG